MSFAMLEVAALRSYTMGKQIKKVACIFYPNNMFNPNASRVIHFLSWICWRNQFNLYPESLVTNQANDPCWPILWNPNTLVHLNKVIKAFIYELIL